ncbi:hypothetical protein NP493_69g05018 [Ridgeia piscesae]|uniref:Uncharacterized protein n=1 Tax=Ridgeia piscesae TaxID=27915 RepID=A0AAD9UIG9_RIDPI|nr:hypothetical protein NP493_69g05018 [Ridgeia piscesae]
MCNEGYIRVEILCNCGHPYELRQVIFYTGSSTSCRSRYNNSSNSATNDNSYCFLDDIVIDVSVINQVNSMSNIKLEVEVERHTGDLEVFHHHLLMYAAKLFSFSYPVNVAWTQLAAVDYQKHKDRPYLLNAAGEMTMADTESVSGRRVLMPEDPRRISRTQAPTTAPSTAELVYTGFKSLKLPN